MQVEARKDDQGKAPMHLFPTDAYRAVVDVLAFGAEQYGRENWRQGMDWTRYYDACLRHLMAWYDGEDCDQESGLPHLAHATCCLVFLLTSQLRGYGRDNRHKDAHEGIGNH